MTKKQMQNKRELEELLEHTYEPVHTKRRKLTGNYFPNKRKIVEETMKNNKRLKVK